MNSNKWLQLMKFMIHIHFFCSLLVYVLFSVPSESFLIASTIGASSGLIAFGVATDVSIAVAPFVRAVIMLWAILFPIALLVTYIVFLKNRVKPICILSLVDTTIVVLWVFFAGFIGNKYGQVAFLPDALISIVYTVLMFWSCQKLSKEKSNIE